MIILIPDLMFESEVFFYRYLAEVLVPCLSTIIGLCWQRITANTSTKKASLHSLEHFVHKSATHPPPSTDKVEKMMYESIPPFVAVLLLLIPKNLLLQHNAVHARLQQCENGCCLPLQPSQSIQNFR